MSFTMPHSAANFHKWFQVLLRGLRGCAVENWNVHEFNPIMDLSMSAHFPFVRAAAFPSSFLFELCFVRAAAFPFSFVGAFIVSKALYLVASRQKSRRGLHWHHHLCFSLWSSILLCLLPLHLHLSLSWMGACSSTPVLGTYHFI